MSLSNSISTREAANNILAFSMSTYMHTNIFYICCVISRLVGWRGATNWLNGRQAEWLAETSRAPLTIHCPIRSGYVIRLGQTKFTSTIENTMCDSVLVSTAAHCQPQSENFLREYWEQNKITALQ